ncbi:MAG: hypothetical protein KGJ23_08080 [Euryarchaeota archaeon]|nr:hypothetical protein [Euryarchaeota archaeon]MDE1836559.1 hypothetical protein [Euryarchaeota archaeon]MDE1879246.1 hypothetical protein [Euryarchaeota archaeon]MDE2044529.1 hypothetical protein [Thermoplasmata archaeon]
MSDRATPAPSDDLAIASALDGLLCRAETNRVFSDLFGEHPPHVHTAACRSDHAVMACGALMDIRFALARQEVQAPLAVLEEALRATGGPSLTGALMWAAYHADNA